MLARVFGALGIIALFFSAPLAANPMVVHGSDWEGLDPTAVFLAGSLDDGGRGWLGVYIQNIEGLKEAMDLDVDEGVLIDDVIEDSPAEDAGLESGDVIIEYDGFGVEDVSELTERVRETKPGTDVEILIIRDGRERSIRATIGEKEKDIDIKSFTLDIPHGLLKGFDMAAEPFAFTFKTGKPRFGVGIQEIDGQLAEFFEVSEDEGVLVTEVYEDSPAEKYGVKAGDVIVEFDGESISDTDELISAVKGADADVPVDVELVRKGKTMTIEVVLPEVEAQKKSVDYYLQELGEDEELQEELEELKKELKKLKMELEKLRSE